MASGSLLGSPSWQLRHVAYRKFINWQFGKLEPFERIPLPSCVVTRIRQKFPSPDGYYKGFRGLGGSNIIINDFIDFDLTASRLYQEACQSGTVSTCQCHIVVMGHEGAGKTSLVRCLFGKSFVEEHIQTNLLDTYKAIVDDKAEKWEDKGEDARIRETKLLVAASMKELDKKKQAEAAKETCAATSATVAGPSKRRKVEREDHSEEPDDAKYGTIPDEVMTFYQKGTNDSCVTIWDFAGQTIFYTLHQIFLTPNTIYLVVNDLTFALDDDLGSDSSQVHGGYRPTTQRGILDCFHKCIEARKSRNENPAQLIVVCTKSDRSELSEETIAERIAAVEDHLKSKTSINCQVKAVYSFSSKYPGNELTKLKGELKSCIQSLETKIPTKWLLFRDKVKKQSHSNWDDVCTIAKENGIEAEYMVRAALTFLHDQGEVIFCPAFHLNKFVITQPEWFIDLVKKVVTLKKYQDTTNISLAQWKELNTTGIVHEDILTECWKDDKENMITLMRALLMLAPWSEDPDDKSKRFVIPSLLPYKPEEDFPYDWNPPPIYIELHKGIIPLSFTSSLFIQLELLSQILAYSEDGNAFCNVATFRRRGYDVWIKEVHINGQDVLQVSGLPQTQTRGLTRRSVEEDTVADFLDDIRQQVSYCQVIRNIPQEHQLLIRCQCGQHLIGIPEDQVVASHLQCQHHSGRSFSITEYKMWFSKDRAPEGAPQLIYDSKLRFPQSVFLGETFTIHVDIRGSPLTSIEWRHNDRPLTDGNSVTIQTAERSSKLEIANMKEDDMGHYVVKAKNSSGSFMANYEVRKCSVHAGPVLPDPRQALNPPDMFGVNVTSKKTVIQHPQSPITLTVPEGAVKEGETCNIIGQVHTDLHNYQHFLEPEHYFITPIVEYTASSDLLQPVQIKIPHCLTGQDLEKNIRVFFLHENNKKEIKKEASEGYSFEVEGDVIVIQTTKLGRLHCECSGIPSVFPACLDLWMTHKLYTTHHVITLVPVLRLGLALQKDFDFIKARGPCIRSKLITTKPADGIEQRWDPIVNFIEERHYNNWREWKSPAHMEFNAAHLYINAPWSYNIVSLPGVCVTSKTGGHLKGLLNIKLSDPTSSRCREISLSMDEEVSSSGYTESPPQLLHTQSHNQSHMIKEGEDLRVKLKLMGKPLPMVSWFHNDEEVQNGGNISTQKSETYTVLEIKGARPCDTGLYLVKASNYLGYFETKIDVLVYESEAEQETLMTDRSQLIEPDVFGVQIRREETVFLQHPRSSIILTLPKGSCREDVNLQKYTVSGQVHTDLQAFTHLLEPEHCFIAPIIRYKTNIDKFLQPVEIELRHCLAPGQDKRDVKVFSTKMDGTKAIRKDPELSFYFDDNFIRIKTQHFCLFDCQAHQRKCSFQSLLNLFMSARDYPIIRLALIIYVGCAEITDFEVKLEKSVDPCMRLTRRKPLNLPGNLCCSRAKTKLDINMTDIEFIRGGGSKECRVALRRIHHPVINGLTEYALKVPLKATHLTGELQVALIDEAGENIYTSFILTEKIQPEAVKAVEKEANQTMPVAGPSHLSGDDVEALARKIMDGLKKKRVEVIKKSVYDDTFSDYIKQDGVVTDSLHEELKNRGPKDRMRELLDYLPKRSTKDQLSFARALFETGQQTILETVLRITKTEIGYIRSMGHPDFNE